MPMSQPQSQRDCHFDLALHDLKAVAACPTPLLIFLCDKDISEVAQGAVVAVTQTKASHH
jgi:hypothetical protein